MIGTKRRPPKNARYGGSEMRWYFCQRYAAVRPIRMPPRTP
jgi:hypothetical protein